MILMDVSCGEGRSAIEATVFIPSSSSSFYDPSFVRTHKISRVPYVLGVQASPRNREICTSSEPIDTYNLFMPAEKDRTHTLVPNLV